jgi:hypothetical protein
MAGMRDCELLSLVHKTVKEWPSKTVSKLGRGRVGEVRQDPAELLETQKSQVETRSGNTARTGKVKLSLMVSFLETHRKLGATRRSLEDFKDAKVA